MRGSRILLVGISVFTLCFTALRLTPHNFGSWDIRLRHNEITCSHSGVNPFHVWNREISSDRFVGLWRPDVKETAGNTGKLTVHAYPAWHTTFFWVWGWMEQNMCVDLVMSINIGLIAILLLYVWRLIPSESVWRRYCAFISTLVLLYHPLHVLESGNYSLFMMFFLLVLYWSLEHKMNIIAGIMLALVMTKPQIGLLCFWPLLFQKRYVVLLTAGIVLTLSLLYPAYLYRESPIDLLLQIPKSGEPYMQVNGNTTVVMSVVFSQLGTYGTMMWQVVCFLLCGMVCFLLRRAKPIFCQWMPVFVFLPFWTYSASHDNCIVWYEYLLIGLACCRMTMFKINKLEHWFFIACVMLMFNRLFWRSIWISSSPACLFSVNAIHVIYVTSFLLQQLTMTIAGFWLMWRIYLNACNDMALKSQT